MEWDPRDRSAGSNYHFLVSAVAPRPIAWVTTLGADGSVNLAPFSWYQAICADPPLVMVAFSDRGGRLKDTPQNIIDRQEFTINGVARELARQMVATSADHPPGDSEAEAAGIAMEPAHTVAPPRVAASPFHLECRLVDHRRWGGDHGTTVIVGEVVHVHARDDVLDERGNIDDRKVALVARLGGRLYLAATDLFELDRPMPPGDRP